MTDLSQLPPLHPERVEHAMKYFGGGVPGNQEMHMISEETARKALEVVQKLQSGFGFAPDLYEKVEMAKTTFGQGKRIHEAIRALLKLK